MQKEFLSFIRVNQYGSLNLTISDVLGDTSYIDTETGIKSGKFAKKFSYVSQSNRAKSFVYPEKISFLGQTGEQIKIEFLYRYDNSSNTNGSIYAGIPYPNFTVGLCIYNFSLFSNVYPIPALWGVIGQNGRIMNDNTASINLGLRVILSNVGHQSISSSSFTINAGVFYLVRFLITYPDTLYIEMINKNTNTSLSSVSLNYDFSSFGLNYRLMYLIDNYPLTNIERAFSIDLLLIKHYTL